jgi:dihydroxy-acid dehydratase
LTRDGAVTNRVAPPGRALRSARWFGSDDLFGLLHRSWLGSEGFARDAFDGRPVIGIANSWSEVTNCNVHLRALAERVKRGVLRAGGFPLEFPVISLAEPLMKPTSMLFRNLMAMDVEECIRAYPFDAVVLLAGCDKTTAAMLMGAASADVPAIMVTGGPMLPGRIGGRELSGPTEIWGAWAERRAGQLADADWHELEEAVAPTAGHCGVMGTASTMASVAEALGMTLPGNAAIPAVHAQRSVHAEEAGIVSVEMALEDRRPSTVLTRVAFENAIAADMAIGGSTNAVVHLSALARRVGVDLPLTLFDEISRRTPLLANVLPSGACQMVDFFYAGGLPAVLAQLLPQLHGGALTVNGRSLAENVADAPIRDATVIRTAAQPLAADGGTVILFGNLCPDGAVLKKSAASPSLLNHRGPAVVFTGRADLAARIDDPDLPITAESVLVLQNGGPRGAPGMPEWGQLPIPLRLIREGVTDLVRISDARMSGTSYGTCILHVAPESAVGGPLAAVRDGDVIELNVEARRLTLDITDDELARRLASIVPPPPAFSRGYGRLYLDHVTQANLGADFDFLEGGPGVDLEPYGHTSH